MDKIVIFLIAGEPSGDVLGGKLIAALKEEIKNNKKFQNKKLEIHGVGGKNMSAQGLKSIFDMSELSLMGFVEIVPHLPKLISRINQTTQAIIDLKPNIVITIDSPDFCFRVIKKLNKNSVTTQIKKVHFVAPTVWAYREKRAQKIAKLFNLLLVILPFEPPYFTKYGLKTKFIGHPITENKVIFKNNDFRKKYKIKSEESLICLTPGSRMGEVGRILPEMLGAIKILHQKQQNLIFAIATTSKTYAEISQKIAEFKKSETNSPKIILVKDDEKLKLFDAADFALAKSGTNTLEMAMYELPMVVTYRTNFITYAIIKMMIKIKFVNLINLILNKEIIKEMLQKDCKAEKLADEMENLIKNKTIAQKQIKESQTVLKLLGLNSKENPSQKAAKEVLSLIEVEKNQSFSKTVKKPAKKVIKK